LAREFWPRKSTPDPERACAHDLGSVNKTTSTLTMSALPSRTRSLRKPAEAGSRYDRTAVDAGEGIIVSRPDRTGQSPSRLPKPPTRTISRPPSATGSVISNSSIRPPPTRANIIFGSPSEPSSNDHRFGTSKERPVKTSADAVSPSPQCICQHPLSWFERSWAYAHKVFLHDPNVFRRSPTSNKEWRRRSKGATSAD
jgi:hypothetical protein